MVRSGGRLLADQLELHGCELIFCVPGESYLALLDGLYDHRDHLRVITCRHETAAANAAEACGKLTGRPGVCMVTRGPGAMQAAVGLHTARQDSTPLVLLVGQISRGNRPDRVVAGPVAVDGVLGHRAAHRRNDLAKIDSADVAPGHGRRPLLVFEAALACVRQAGGPALIELLTDPDALTPGASPAETRSSALDSTRA